MRKAEFWIIVMILTSFLLAGYFQFCDDRMPQKMASHWDANGEVNGYMPKAWALFLMPVISIVLFCILIFLPRLDPLKANIDKFRKHYNFFLFIIFAFLLYIYLLTIFWNLGYEFSMNTLLVPVFGVVFFYAGILISHAKRNYFIGIRTPWTLASDEVWEKTHKIGGRLFKLSGILAVIGVFFDDYAFWFVLVPVLLASVFLFVYSYLMYKRLPAKKTGKALRKQARR